MTWLDFLRRYLAFLAIANLFWEAAHMPLYTLWSEGTYREIVVFGLHCVVGDVLIGLSALALGLLLFGTEEWPREGFRTVAGPTVALGVAYTAWSEWYNVRVLESWAYSALMPVEPVFGIGLSPIAQWIVIPLAAFWWARRGRRASPGRATSP